MDYLSIFYFLFASVLCTCTFMYIEKVRGGSRDVNHPDRVREPPAHLVSPVTL